MRGDRVEWAKEMMQGGSLGEAWTVAGRLHTALNIPIAGVGGREVRENKLLLE